MNANKQSMFRTGVSLHKEVSARTRNPFVLTKTKKSNLKQTVPTISPAMEVEVVLMNVNQVGIVVRQPHKATACFVHIIEDL